MAEKTQLINDSGSKGHLPCMYAASEAFNLSASISGPGAHPIHSHTAVT